MKTAYDKFLEEQLQNPVVKRIFDEDVRSLNIGIEQAKVRKKKG